MQTMCNLPMLNKADFPQKMIKAKKSTKKTAQNAELEFIIPSILIEYAKHV